MATTVQMNSITDAMNLSPEERKKNVTKISLTTGLEAAFKIGIVSIPTALVLTKYWKPFTRNLGVSGRTAVGMLLTRDNLCILAYKAFFSNHPTAFCVWTGFRASGITSSFSRSLC